MWMLAEVAETDSPLYRKGQEVHVKVAAFPDRDFEGKITNIGATVDPNTHTILVRSDVADPKHELRPGMFATYVINVDSPMNALGIPLNGVVREGDGTMTVWVATDTHHFVRRTVRIGLQENGYDQIVDGLAPGERVVTDGAVFLSNMVNAAAVS
jgi:cobalt-zinc-cadmium efflux system membrane fusion protein